MAKLSPFTLHKGDPDYEEQVQEVVVLIEEWHGASKFKPLTPMTSAFRQKDVAIGGDPKFREMSHFLTSHTHQDRMVDMHLGPGESSPRKDGIESMNRRVRSLAHEAKSESPTHKSFPSSPRFAMAGSSITGGAGTAGWSQSSPSQPSSSDTPLESPRKMLGMDAELNRRLKWREELDRNLRRLMTDVELGRDPNMRHHGHKMVCEQFEKRYDWFRDCGDKEVVKEQKGPPFMRYDPGKPVMAGSTRGIPRN